MKKEQDLSELLDAIVWGHRIIEVPSDSDEKTFVFRPLTLQERNMGNYIYTKTKRSTKAAGMLDREQLTKQAIKHGLWRSSYDDNIETLRKELSEQIDALKIEERTNMLDKHGKSKRKTATSKFVRLTARVTSIRQTMGKLEQDHTQHIELPSAEHNAEYERGMFFLMCSTLSFPDMNTVWPTFDILKDEEDTTLVSRLMNQFYSTTIAEEIDIRRLARSGFWRSKWMGSKKNRGVKTLFNREMYDLTVDQFRLVYWSQIYDSAFESMEAPSDDVIEDDKLFDRWLDEQHKKHQQDRKKSSFDKKIKHLKHDAHEVGLNVQGEYCEECTCGVRDAAESRGYDKRGDAHDPSCPYGVFLYYNSDKKQQKIEEVQSANPDSIRRRLAGEQKRLSTLGEGGMEEQQLRGDISRAAFGMDTKWHGGGEPGKGQRGKVRPS